MKQQKMSSKKNTEPGADFFKLPTDKSSSKSKVTDNEPSDDTETVNTEVELITPILTSLFGKEGAVKVGEQVLAYQKNKIATQLKIEEIRLKAGERNSKYFTTQYFQDMGMVAMVLVAIIILSWQGIIETSTTGTLMGSIIGYALGQIRERYRSKS